MQRLEMFGPSVYDAATALPVGALNLTLPACNAAADQTAASGGPTRSGRPASPVSSPSRACTTPPTTRCTPPASQAAIAAGKATGDWRRT
jgi:hypothetical protein